LLKAGAKVDSFDARGLTPLGLAAMTDHAPMVKLLLAAGANPRLASRDERREAALEVAARMSRENAGLALLEEEPARDEAGWSALLAGTDKIRMPVFARRVEALMEAAVLDRAAGKKPESGKRGALRV
jgi:ankyrin repeat protein